MILDQSLSALHPWLYGTRTDPGSAVILSGSHSVFGACKTRTMCLSEWTTSTLTITTGGAITYSIGPGNNEVLHRNIQMHVFEMTNNAVHVILIPVIWSGPRGDPGPRAWARSASRLKTINGKHRSWRLSLQDYKASVRKYWQLCLRWWWIWSRRGF